METIRPPSRTLMIGGPQFSIVILRTSESMTRLLDLVGADERLGFSMIIAKPVD
jgi:hypothetical protein